MARPKKDAAPKPVGGNLTHNTSNQLSDDDLHALTLQHKRSYATALAAKKAASEFLNVCKLAKSELGEGAIKDIKQLVAIDEDENYQEKFEAEIERQARIARWAGLEIGTQASMFDISNTAPSIAEKAYSDGKRTGLAGEILEAAPRRWHQAYGEFVRGWHDGQAVNAGLIKKKETAETPLLRPEANEPSQPDDLDNVATGPETPFVAGEWPDDAQVEARQDDDVSAEAI